MATCPQAGADNHRTAAAYQCLRSLERHESCFEPALVAAHMFVACSVRSFLHDDSLLTLHLELASVCKLEASSRAEAMHC